MEKKKALKSGSNLSSAFEDEEIDYWQNHIDNWLKSGLSQAAYCRSHNLDIKRFHRWKSRLSTYPSGETSVKLVEVKRDFASVPQSGPSIPPFGNGTAGFNKTTNSFAAVTGSASGSSGIRFWCREFCVEVDKHFDSETLLQLVRTLQGVYVSGSQSFSPVADSVTEE